MTAPGDESGDTAPTTTESSTQAAAECYANSSGSSCRRNPESCSTVDATAEEKLTQQQADLVGGWFEAYSGDLVAHLRQVGADPEQVNDCRNEAFQRVAHAVLRKKKIKHPKAYILAAARNHYRDLLRSPAEAKTSRLGEIPDTADIVGVSERTTEDPAEQVIRNADTAEREAQREALRRAIAQLEPLDRTIVDLRGLQCLPETEVSQILKIARGTLSSRYKRARDKLKKTMAAQGYNMTIQEGEDQ